LRKDRIEVRKATLANILRVGPPVQLQQVEGIEELPAVRFGGGEEVKGGQSPLAATHHLAVEAGPHLEVVQASATS
jgi:hypothetical protein